MIWRIGLFYLVSIFIVVALVPWNDPTLANLGSYQTVLERMGIPNAKMIVDIVVLVAVTSCLNSALYTSSRMLFSSASAAMHRRCRLGSTKAARHTGR